MNNNEFVKQIHEDLKKQGYSKNLKESTAIFETVFNNLYSTIVEGRKVVIDNFGTFRSDFVTYQNNFKKSEGPKEVQKVKVKFVPSTKMETKINEKIKAKTS